MGASEHIKKAMESKGITPGEMAERMGKPRQTIYNNLCRDTFTFSCAESFAAAAGCDIVLRDKETGETY